MTSPNSLNKEQRNKEKIVRAFSRSSKTYDKYASLQKTLAKELVETVRNLRLKPNKILDIGTGTGEAAFAFKRYSPTRG
jgi:ubiquinone/menaquinone biosynthesis C-methylase UbiE